MLARAVRSGLTESYHDGAIAAVAFSGELLLEIGEIDQAFFYRSAMKPFQATVVLEAGLTSTVSKPPSPPPAMADSRFTWR